MIPAIALCVAACVHDNGNTYTGPGPSFRDSSPSGDSNSGVDSDNDTSPDTGVPSDTAAGTDSVPDPDTDTAAPPDSCVTADTGSGVPDSGCPVDPCATVERDTSVPVDTAADASRDWVSVTAGRTISCGIRADGTSACWGDEICGGEADIPQAAFTSITLASEDGGYPCWDQHGCGLLDDGTAVCWGEDGFGQADAPDGTFIQVVAGDTASCGLSIDGTITCWGLAPAGYTGSDWARISAGGHIFAALDAVGDLTIWNSEDYSADPVAVPGTYTDVAANSGGVCATRADGTVSCYGPYSHCGFSTGPAPEGTLHGVCVTNKDVACGLNGAGYPVCWSARPDVYNALLLEPPARPLTELSCGAGYVCGVAPDGAIVCWGYADFGELTPP